MNKIKAYLYKNRNKCSKVPDEDFPTLCNEATSSALPEPNQKYIDKVINHPKSILL